ncbi:hypothetical protein [Pseudaestuariivita rosea]|uniref:hypothetical protein n=1 Tax=Pseudaestuariivita rosea TaxID=2763263 RepID=UPI001ABAB320|nr:hypothetical protein [Pseudaestuariivita rosea]
MADRGFTDEELMAYADGELDEARASQIDLALAADAALADRLAMFTGSRGAISDAYAPDLDQPVPDVLIARVHELDDKTRRKPDAVTQLTGAPSTAPAPANTNRTPMWQTAVAACVALVVGLGAGFMLTEKPSTNPASLQITELADPAIVQALTAAPSGETLILQGGHRFAAVATFRDAAGTLCREFEYDQATGRTIVSVACHRDNSWTVQFAVAAPAGNESGYAPASSMETLDTYLASTGADLPLSPEDEAEALRALQ